MNFSINWCKTKWKGTASNRFIFKIDNVPTIVFVNIKRWLCNLLTDCKSNLYKPNESKPAVKQPSPYQIVSKWFTEQRPSYEVYQLNVVLIRYGARNNDSLLANMRINYLFIFRQGSKRFIYLVSNTKKYLLYFRLVNENIIEFSLWYKLNHLDDVNENQKIFLYYIFSTDSFPFPKCLLGLSCNPNLLIDLIETISDFYSNATIQWPLFKMNNYYFTIFFLEKHIEFNINYVYYRNVFIRHIFTNIQYWIYY